MYSGIWVGSGWLPVLTAVHYFVQLCLVVEPLGLKPAARWRCGCGCRSFKIGSKRGNDRPAQQEKHQHRLYRRYVTVLDELAHLLVDLVVTDQVVDPNVIKGRPEQAATGLRRAWPTRSRSDQTWRWPREAGYQAWSLVTPEGRRSITVCSSSDSDFLLPKETADRSGAVAGRMPFSLVPRRELRP
jgi:hypothetical protein